MSINKRNFIASTVGAGGHNKGTVIISRGTYSSTFTLSANSPSNPTSFTAFDTHSYYIGVLGTPTGVMWATSQGNAEWRDVDKNGLSGSNQTVVSPFADWFYGGRYNGTVAVCGSRVSPYFAYKADPSTNSGSWTGASPGGQVFYEGVGYTGSHWVSGTGNRASSIKPVYYSGGATPGTATTWSSHDTPNNYGGFAGFDVDEVNGNMCTSLGRLSGNDLYFWNGTDPSTATSSYKVDLHNGGWSTGVRHNDTCWVATTSDGYYFSDGMTPSSASDWTSVSHNFSEGGFGCMVWDGDTWWRINGNAGVQYCTDAQLTTSSTWTSVTVPGSGNYVYSLNVAGTTYQHGMPRSIHL